MQIFLCLPGHWLQVDPSRAGRLLPHRVVVRRGVRPGEESLRLVPVQSAGPAGEEDGREPGEVLQLLRQHVQDGLQAAAEEGRRYRSCHTRAHSHTHTHTHAHAHTPPKPALTENVSDGLSLSATPI